MARVKHRLDISSSVHSTLVRVHVTKAATRSDPTSYASVSYLYWNSHMIAFILALRVIRFSRILIGVVVIQTYLIRPVS
jgi:hypothetical protein